MTALLEYLDLLQCLKFTVLGHVHLSACNINNSPHKLGFQFSMRAGDQKLRFDLVWPYLRVIDSHKTSKLQLMQGRRRRSGWSGLSRTNNLELNQLADQL